MEDNELLKQLAQSVKEFRNETSLKLDTIKSSVSELDKQVALLSKETEYIKREDARQNELIAEHIAGVKEVRVQNGLIREELTHSLQAFASSLESRIKKLEGPREWIKNTLYLVLTVGGVAYALFHIIELYKSLPK